jgi:hypothetical protein
MIDATSKNASDECTATAIHPWQPSFGAWPMSPYAHLSGVLPALRLVARVMRVGEPDKRTRNPRYVAFMIIAVLTVTIVPPAGPASAATSAPLIADIVVYGGTPAGVLAAVTAKRADKRLTVVLIEPTKHIGGMMSSGLGWTDVGSASTIGGYSRELFDRIQRAERTVAGRYRFEPHVAEAAFRAMLKSARVTVRQGQALRENKGVAKSGTRITSITTTTGQVYRAKTFIDASYEGDLMAQAGVSYTVGRESRAKYGESLAGVRPARLIMTLPRGATLPHDTGPPGPLGSADDRIQDSNYRVCLSSDRANRVSFAKPAGYDAGDHTVVLGYIAKRRADTNATPALDWLMNLRPVANRKFDVNNYGLLSTAVTGLNHDYAEGSYAQRAKLDRIHRVWAKGLLHFLRYDRRVPDSIRSSLGKYGLCRDEFTDNGNWPRLLYQREGRRMIGEYVMRQSDIDRWRTKTDMVAIASYRIDAHFVSRWVDNRGLVWTEGSMKLPGYVYAVPYRIMLPKAREVTNLLVPVTSSASHVAQSSLRMEPQYMMMGEAAGQAAAMTIKVSTKAGNKAIGVHDVSVTTLQARLRAHGAYLVGPTNGR